MYNLDQANWFCYCNYEILLKKGFILQLEYLIPFEGLGCNNYLSEETIQGRKLLIYMIFLLRKLLKGGNYSREETIRGNTVIITDMFLKDSFLCPDLATRFTCASRLSLINNKVFKMSVCATKGSNLLPIYQIIRPSCSATRGSRYDILDGSDCTYPKIWCYLCTFPNNKTQPVREFHVDVIF